MASPALSESYATSNVPLNITIAIDTEFFEAHTLTVQAACRLSDGSISVQVYRSPAIPDIPDDFDIAQYAPADNCYDAHLTICAHAKPLTPWLSPMDLVADLLDLPDTETLTRAAGDELIESFQEGVNLPPNAKWNKRKRRWTVPTVNLRVVAHFLRADLFRFMGWQFVDDLLHPDHDDGVCVKSRKLLRFEDHGKGPYRGNPVIGYVQTLDGCLYEIRLSTFDTMLPFGKGSLDVHCKTFLGLPKADCINPEDKNDMRRTFAEKTVETYGYSICDVVNTLLLYEALEDRDRMIYGSFGFGSDDTPRLQPTMGSRVAEFIFRTSRRHASGSTRLKRKRHLKQLMARSGCGLFSSVSGASRFGAQSAGVHGGLLFSRSPYQLWHESPGMLRDVDMSGCYNSIITGLALYWGRPVILEPGSNRMSLREAVEYVQQHADPDAWLIRVTGDIPSGGNVLIPSAKAAITSENYRQRTRARQDQEAEFIGEPVELPRMDDEDSGSKLYSARVEFGVVTWPTWLMIQALPESLRGEYEQSLVDSIVFYPRKFVAADGAEFDALMAQYGDDGVPWKSVLDLGWQCLTTTEIIDGEYVSLRYPIGQFAEQIGQFREEAKQTEGKGTGGDTAWKLQANTMYGVLASPHLPTNNFVAANQITAKARTLAYAMQLSLNGIQVITDGCTYRLDQIPDCTFAECLSIQPDYPLRRADADSGIPFVDPAAIPTGDAEFTDWFRQHVKRFFGVSGAEYDQLFSTHQLEHKLTGSTQTAAFDALACDGCGNYIKCTRDDSGGWRVEEIKARAYRNDSKQVLKDWIVPTYSSDRMEALPPVTEDRNLLSYDKAREKARAALRSGIPKVYVPLGLSYQEVRNYRAIKDSAFVFQTPQQWKTILKQIERFEKHRGCGLELLALRRSYGDRQQGSLVDVASAIYELLQSGGHDLTSCLNLNHLGERLQRLADVRLDDIEARKGQALQDLFDRIDIRRVEPDTIVTGYIVDRTKLRS